MKLLLALMVVIPYFTVVAQTVENDNRVTIVSEPLK